MSNRSIRSAAAIALALLVMGGAVVDVNVARGDTIVTSGLRTRDIEFFGEKHTEMYGQTFTVGADNVLTSFAFDLAHRSGPSTDFNFFVMAWDGDSASGPVLFQAGPYALTFTNPAYQTFTFNTGLLSLTSGQQYVAFVDSIRNDTDDQAIMAGTMNTYAGGEFVFLHGQGNSIESARMFEWQKNFVVLHGDTRFTATFTSAAVPLPAAATAGFALMGIIATKRARRRGAAMESAAA